MNQSAKCPLKVGIFLPFAKYMMDRQTPRWSDLLAMTQRAEALSFDSVWLGDHLLAWFPEPRIGLMDTQRPELETAGRCLPPWPQ